PLCVSNQTVLYTVENLAWAGRTTTYTFIKTDSIGGELYFVEEAKEYRFNIPENPHAYNHLWLKKNVNGEILIRAICHNYPILDSAIIFPMAGLHFSNNFFTVGYSITQTIEPNKTRTDSVISTNATFGIFNSCIQIRRTYKINDTIDVIEDSYYTLGVGYVGLNRIFPANSVHTDNLVSTFVTGCDPIVDTLPANITDTCLGQYFDYYVTNVQIDTINNTVTVTWVFHVDTISNQFIQIYNYQYQGNNVISITIQCNKTATTYYKTINIGSSPIVGVDEIIEQNSKIKIYPNPTSEVLTVKSIRSSNEALTLNIYNVMGALVKTETLEQNQQQINIGDLSNGIYMVEIKSKEWSKKQKLIIQK
ncbi:MAG: T9SS type A sorting domain-containing protein, partial [Bacteroidales bacterium]